METDKITSSYRQDMGSVQRTVDVVLQKEDENSILKILSSTASAYLDDIEMLNGEAHYVGGVVFNCLYVDSQGKNHVLSDKVDINDKFENAVLNPLMKPICKIEVVEITTEILDEDRVKLTASIEITFDVIKTDEIDQIRSNDSSIQVLKEPIKQYSVVASGNKTFNLNETYDTKYKIEKVLFTTAHTVLKNVTSGTGYFTVEGDVFVNSLVEVATDEGTELKNFMQTLPFKEELEDEMVQKDDITYAFAYTRPQDITVEIAGNEQSETNNSVSLNLTVTVKYVTLRMTDQEIYTDVFSTTNKTNLVTDSFVLTKSTKRDNFKATIEGQTTITEDEPRIAKICAVTGEHITIANTGVVEGELTIEGIIYASVVYLTDDDIPAKNSVELEIPFSNKFDATDLNSEGLFITAHIVDIEVKARKGKEINATVDVVFSVDSYQTENQVCVKEIELTEELLPRDYSLAIYIAPKGSSLWEVCKHLLVDEEELMSQNPDVVFPLESPQSIVYFKQRVWLQTRHFVASKQ